VLKFVYNISHLYCKIQGVFCKITDYHSSGARDSVHLGSYFLSSGICRRFGECFTFIFREI